VETARPTNPAAEEILGRYFPVLDHGFVSLVDYMGGDEDVERAARVSYGYGTRKTSQTRGLIRYLRRHRHTTPSEMVEFKFHCAMPMFVARQWIRHRTASVNEYSGRYSLLPMLFYTPEAAQFQAQSATNRQGRAGETLTALHPEALARWERIRRDAAGGYEWMVTLRVDPHAQYEIRAYAAVMAGMAQRVAPLSYEAWLDYDYGGEKLSRGEIRALRRLLAADEAGIVATGGRLGREALAECGLAAREIDELLAKLRTEPSAEDFTLDVAASRSADEVEGRMAAAVPKVDRT